LGIPVGFGLGLALTNGHLSRVESVRPDEPRWVLKETLPELLELRAALSLRPMPWLAFGAGAGFLATTRGGFEVTGDAIFADGKGAEYDSQLRHSVAAELLSSRYLVLGAQLRLPSLLAKSSAPIAWSLGLAFKDEAALSQQLQGTLRGNVDAGFLQVPVQYRFDAHSLVAFQPRQVVLGISAERQAWRLNVDLGFEQWSRYPSPVARSAAHIEADVPAGLPLALPPNTELPAATSAGFHDRLTWRAGVERSVELSGASELLLRAGYAYLPSPAPRVSDAAQLLDTSEHVFSLGTGVALRRLARWLPHRVELDAFGLYGHLPNRRLERQGMLFQAKGHVVSAGLTLTLGGG
jgi:long-chain fatty acid transport protein